jgi:hypothetical protein
VLSLYGVPEGELGKLMRGCRRLLDGDEETPFPSASIAITKYFSLSMSLPWADVRLELFGGARSPGRKDNGVGALAVQLTEGAITDAAIAN